MLLLAAVLWLDGWRRLPSDALLLRKMGPGPWRIAEPWARLGAFALVGLWPPLVMPFVVTSGDTAGRSGGAHWTRDFTVAVARSRRRLRRVAISIAGLRIVGVLLTLWIIVGIPLATSRSALRGLLLGILGAFCLAIWMAIVTGAALRALGAGWREAVRASLPVLSPFSAVRAAEVVIDHASGGAPALARAAALLGDNAFRAWLRPHAYDALYEEGDAAGRTGLAGAVAALPRDRLLSALGAPLASDTAGETSGAYCPRCATGYERTAAGCAGCSGVALLQR